MKLRPRLNQFDLARRKISLNYFACPDIHDPFMLGVLRVEMRWRVLVGREVHPYDDTVEH